MKRWSDAELREAVAASTSLSQVPLLLLGESGIKSVREQLRRREKERNFWYRLFVLTCEE